MPAGLSARIKIQSCSWRLKLQLAAGPPNKADAWPEVAGHVAPGGPLESTLGVGPLGAVRPLGTRVATQDGKPVERAIRVARFGGETVGVAGNKPPRPAELGAGVGEAPLAILAPPGSS